MAGFPRHVMHALPLHVAGMQSSSAAPVRLLLRAVLQGERNRVRKAVVDLPNSTWIHAAPVTSLGPSTHTHTQYVHTVDQTFSK